MPEESIRAKFVYRNKRNGRNLVAEVDTTTWRTLSGRKLKIGWQLCRVEDYIKINRCFRCSKFNHKAVNCSGEETCPLCAGQHKLKECKATEEDLKCINCIMYNKYNKAEKLPENHSSMDKNCPCLQTLIRKCKQNTEY